MKLDRLEHEALLVVAEQPPGVPTNGDCPIDEPMTAKLERLGFIKLLYVGPQRDLRAQRWPRLSLTDAGEYALALQHTKLVQDSTGWPNGDDVVRAKMGGKARPQLPVATSPKPGARPFNAKVSRRVPVAQRETIT